MSEYVQDAAETKHVRHGQNSTGVVLVLFILLVIITSIFFA